MRDNETLWYALGCTSPKRELKIRDDARRYGLDAFVPLKYEVKKVRGVERRVLVPAVTQIVLVKGTLEEVEDYIAHAHFVVFIRRSTYTNHKVYLTVTPQAMENFIAVTEMTERHVTYFRPEEITLREGDQIRIRGGLYDGREGIIMRIKGKRNKHLVVQIPGILIAAIELSQDMIDMVELPSSEVSEEASVAGEGAADGPGAPAAGKAQEGVKTSRSLRSKDLDKDRKFVFELAHRLLFEFADKYQNENEYYLLRSELERARDCITGFKGFTASSEAELALPLYLASVILDKPVGGAGGTAEAGETPVGIAQARLQKAIGALKPSSLLRVRCQLYLAILTHDEALLAELSALFASWRKAPLSVKQRALLEEYSLLTEK